MSNAKPLQVAPKAAPKVAPKVAIKVAPKPPLDPDKAVLSSFLRRTLPALPLYDRPPTWRLWLWQWLCGGKHGSAFASVAATGSFLKAVLDSPNLNSSCVALMDVALMLGTVFYQVTFTNRRATTRRMIEDLAALAEEMEVDATTEERADLRATVSAMNRTRRLTALPVIVIPGLMLLGPFLTGELTMSFYPKPTGIFWYLVCICQCIGTVTCPLCVNAIMFTLLMVSSSAAALCRCISGRMLVARGERVLRLARLHRLVLETTDRMADVYYLTLFILITGLLTTSLLATYNVATGDFDSYTALLVPGPLAFYYNIAMISDQLAISTVAVCDGVWGCAWTEESVPVRRVVLSMMVRAQKEGSVRVPLLGAVTLPVFKDSMRQWYSYLQMIRSFNGG